MFDFFRRHTKIFQIVLFPVILLSFGVFGIQSYSRMSGNDAQTVAKVGGQNITQVEWDNEVRKQVERMRAQRPTMDVKDLDTPELRRNMLDALVRERVFALAADKLNLSLSDERLQHQFSTDPQFASLRNPDGSVSADALGALGMSSEGFAERLRANLSSRQVVVGLTGSAIGPANAASAALDALYQQREIQTQLFAPKDYLAKVAPTEAEIDAYYKDPAHAAQFLAPERTTVEYVLLDVDALKKDIVPTDAELKSYYDTNVKQLFTVPEERQVSDIIIKVDKGAAKAERDRAKAKAEEVLADVRKAPGTFADVARKRSEDRALADKGGDLGFIGRGDTVKAIEDTIFKLKVGEVGDVVEGDDGFHIIKLAAVRGGEARSFESARAEIDSALRLQMAQAKFTQAAGDFKNLVYEQAESLKPAAERWKLEVKTAQNIARAPSDKASAPFNNAQFLDALFAKDSLEKKHNTEAIPVGNSQFASGRVVAYTPSQVLPLATVKTAVRDRLAAEQANALAKKSGIERLAALRKAPDEALSGTALTLSRAQPRGMPPPLLDAALQVAAPPVPAFVGVDLGTQGYAIAKVVKVLGRDPVASIDMAAGQAQYTQAWADAESLAYYAALKTRYKVDIKTSALKSAPAATGSDSGVSDGVR